MSEGPAPPQDLPPLAPASPAERTGETHVEGVVTDQNGNVLGTVASDQVQRLSDLSLVKNAGS